MPLGVLLFAACVEPEPTPDPEVTPSAWAPELGELDGAGTAATIEARMQEAVDAARWFHASPIVDGYQVAMQGATDVCPTWYGIGEFSYWYDTCTADDGSFYDGYVFVQPAESSPEYSWTGLFLWGAGTIVTPAGFVMHVGGRVEDTSTTGNGMTLWHSKAQGSFRWDGPEADGTWLSAGYDLDIDSLAMTSAGNGGRSLSLEGGVYGFDDPLSTVRFEALMAELPCDTCTIEPSGMMSTRDADGRWYEVAFGSDEGDASCGTVSSEGEDLGEQVCLDFSALVEWTAEDGPW